MSIISRPVSSFSQYRPGTGYVGLLPNLRPNSSLPVRFKTSYKQIIPTRLHSRLPITRAQTKSCDDIYQIKPMSRISNQDRSEHQWPVRLVKSNQSVLLKHENFSPACLAKLDTEYKDYGLLESLTRGLMKRSALMAAGSRRRRRSSYRRRSSTRKLLHFFREAIRVTFLKKKIHGSQFKSQMGGNS
ncbi:hypothetical protein AGLY_014915 [Aphis glycines]|uniref:Uncharacterized protein n=1 Tax=Aphis glycines TaxID=307491 RepID=A0A6G0T3E7_APHGL|nr:hypothetical protein AGLY_014915 [Aphis glycines]